VTFKSDFDQGSTRNHRTGKLSYKRKTANSGFARTRVVSIPDHSQKSGTALKLCNSHQLKSLQVLMGSVCNFDIVLWMQALEILKLFQGFHVLYPKKMNVPVAQDNEAGTNISGVIASLLLCRQGVNRFPFRLYNN
jgi:hypothetical protein